MLKMNQAEMDQIVNDHFMYEFNDNVDGVVSTLTEDAVHEIVGGPLGPRQGRAAIRRFYEQLFPDIKGEAITPVMRLYGENFIIDVTLWAGQVFNGKHFNLDGRSGKASIRLLHIFRLREGKIELENVWFDYNALKNQLT
jgi:ketosteroid isomerase-like protein